MDTASNRTKLTARRCTTAVLSLAGVALVAACSASGTTGSGSTTSPAASASATGTLPSGSAAACAQIKALRSTLTDLSTTHVGPASAPRIASDLAKAEQELNALKSQAGPFSAQANQLSNSLNAIKAAGTALAQSPTPTNITKLVSAVNSFRSTAQPVIKEMDAACP